MKLSVSILLLLIFTACSQGVDKNNLKNINGYWEIEEVTLPSGEKKTYSINTLVDYFELKDTKGFRKKVAPQLDGTFLKTEDEEAIEVLFEGTETYLHYSTPFHSWKETILKIDENRLVLKNENEVVYSYKRFEPLNLSQ